MKLIFLFLCFLLLGIAVNYLPVERTVLPYIGNVDAHTYIELSKEIENSYANDLDFFGFVLGGLNWFSLPYLLYLIDIETGYWRMAIVNSAVLLLIISQLFILGKKLVVSPTLFVTLCLVMMPFLWCWLFIPSKENFTVLGFLILFNYFRGAINGRSHLVMAVLCGIMKSQIIASFFFKKLIDYCGKYYFICSLLVINFVTILVNILFPEALSVELYLTIIPEEINSAALIQQLDQLVRIPVVGIVGVLLRLCLYMAGGISAVKSMFVSFESALMTFSSVGVSLLTCLFVIAPKKKFGVEFKIFWTFLCIFLFIPFIQFRYFWWTIPMLLYFIFSMKPKVEVQPDLVLGVRA